MVLETWINKSGIQILVCLVWFERRRRLITLIGETTKDLEIKQQTEKLLLRKCGWAAAGIRASVFLACCSYCRPAGVALNSLEFRGLFPPLPQLRTWDRFTTVYVFKLLLKK